MGMGLRLDVLTDSGHKEIELDLLKPPTLTLQVKDFTVIGGEGNNRAYFTNEITAVWTHENCKALGLPFDLNVLSSRDVRGKRKQAILEYNTLTFRGEIVSMRAVKENGLRSIVFQFVGQYANWASSLNGCKLSDLRFGEFVSDLNTVDALMADEDLYNGNNPTYMGLVWYGEPRPIVPPTGNPTPDFIPLTEIRPQVAAKAVIEAIGRKSNTRIKSDFFNTEYFRNKWYPASRKEIFYEVLTADLNSNELYGDGTGFSTLNFVLNDWTFTDFGGIVNTINGFMRFNPSFPDSKITVKLNLNVNVISGNPYLYIIGDVTATSYVGGDILQNGQNELEYTYDINSGDLIDIVIAGGTVELMPTTTVFIYLESTRWLEGVRTWASSVLPSIEINDYISGLTDSYNLIWFYDEKNECLIVEPKFPVSLPTGESIKGFVLQYINEKIDPLFDCLNKETDFFIANDYSQIIIQKFKEDDKDLLVSEGENLYASETILSDKFKVGESEIENRVFAATKNDLLPTPFGVEGVPNGQPLVPFMINYDPDDTGANKSAKYDYELRELCKCGLVSGDWVWYTDNNVVNVYPKLAQVDFDCGFNAGYSDFRGIQGKTSLFFNKDFDLYNFSTIEKIEGFVNKAKLQDLEKLFRYLLWVDIDGASQGKRMVESVQITLDDSSRVIFTVIPLDY